MDLIRNFAKEVTPTYNNALFRRIRLEVHKNASDSERAFFEALSKSDDNARNCMASDTICSYCKQNGIPYEVVCDAVCNYREIGAYYEITGYAGEVQRRRI